MRFLKIHLRYIHFLVYSALREIERKRKDAKRQIKWTVLNGFPFPSIRPASELYASVEISKAVDLFKRQPDTGACPLSVDPSSLLAGWDGWDYLHSLVVGVDGAHDGAVQRCWFEAMDIHQLVSRNGFIYQGGYRRFEPESTFHMFYPQESFSTTTRLESTHFTSLSLDRRY